MYADMETRSFGLPPASADRTAAWIENLHDTGWNLVACIDDTLVGHVAVAPADEPAPKLVVFVAEGHRGRGIGTELLRHAVAHGRARDYERLRLRVERGNHSARSVYTTVGFELAERTSPYLEMAFPMDSPAARDTCRPPRARSESATHR